MFYQVTIRFIALIIFVGLGHYAFSQDENRFDLKSKWKAWGIRVQGQSFSFAESKLDTCDCEGKRDLFQRGNAGVVISYMHGTGNRLNYTADLGFSYGRVGTMSVPTLSAKTRLFTAVRLGANYHLGKQDQPILPYLHTALHMQIGSNYSSLLTGAGLRYVFNRLPLLMTTELNYGYGITSKLRNSVVASVGFYLNLWGKKTVQASASIESKGASAQSVDSDFDGVPDSYDKCPQLKGDIINGGCPSIDSDGDGVVDAKDNCPTVAGAIENKGCPIVDSDGDGVIDSKDNCPTVSGDVSNGGCPSNGVSSSFSNRNDSLSQMIYLAMPSNFLNIVRQQIVDTIYKTVNNGSSSGSAMSARYIVYFNFNKYDLTLAEDTLQKVAATLATDTSINCTLIGHTDTDGSIEYNVILSRNRAEAVKSRLIELGVNTNRITILYSGKDKPAVLSTNRSTNLLNRRVEILLTR